MKQKEHKRREDFRAGYIRGYYGGRISSKELAGKTKEFKRGYGEARRDVIDGEYAQFAR